MFVSFLCIFAGVVVNSSSVLSGTLVLTVFFNCLSMLRNDSLSFVLSFCYLRVGMCGFDSHGLLMIFAVLEQCTSSSHNRHSVAPI